MNRNTPLSNMYQPTFSCQDEKEQFEAKVKAIADEELKELKKKQDREKFLSYFWKRVEADIIKQRNTPIHVDDYDYQHDMETEMAEGLIFNNVTQE